RAASVTAVDQTVVCIIDLDEEPVVARALTGVVFDHNCKYVTRDSVKLTRPAEGAMMAIHSIPIGNRGALERQTVIVKLQIALEALGAGIVLLLLVTQDVYSVMAYWVSLV